MITCASTRRILVVAVVVLNVCACATVKAPRPTAPDSATADTVALSPSGTVYDFECDVPPGHDSFWSKTVSGNGVAISGNLQFKALRRDPLWFPSALIGIGLGDHDKTSGAVRLEWRSATDYRLVSALLATGPSGSERIIGTFIMDKGLVHFSVRLTPDSVLRVSIAGINGSVQLPRAHPRIVELGCSTADMRFSNVTVATSAGTL